MKSNYKPLIVAVFLVLGGLAARAGLILHTSSDIKVVRASSFSAGSSPILIGVAQAQSIATADSVIVTDSALGDQTEERETADPTYAVAAVQDSGQPIGAVIDPSESFQYTVKKGDTLSSIASQFNISAASILNANPNISKKNIKIGAVLTIPASAPSASATTNTAQSLALPNFNGDFIMPTQGYDYGVLDANNGVNIVNSCGTPVVAAADGVVVPDQNISVSASGWNDGYGNFILVEQPFGNEIYTRYSHLQQSLVTIGDYVKQGQQIGLIGQSGGASACELNFQVIGAQNPFGK